MIDQFSLESLPEMRFREKREWLLMTYESGRFEKLLKGFVMTVIKSRNGAPGCREAAVIQRD